MPDERAEISPSEQIRQQALAFFEGAQIGSGRLRGLYDTLLTHDSRESLRSLREAVVTARNSRGIWARLTGKSTLEMVTSESSLRIAELQTVTSELSTHEKDVTVAGYRDARLKTDEFQDSLTDAYAREYRIDGDMDPASIRFRSSDQAINVMYEIADDIISPTPSRLRNNILFKIQLTAKHISRRLRTSFESLPRS